jgi:hypothetical protein
MKSDILSVININVIFFRDVRPYILEPTYQISRRHIPWEPTIFLQNYFVWLYTTRPTYLVTNEGSQLFQCNRIVFVHNNRI